MADDFDSGLSWWSNTRTTSNSSSTSFDSSAAITAAAASASCSSATADAGGIATIDSSSLQVPAAFSMDWNQALLRSGASTHSNSNPGSFHSMLQESLSYPSIEPSQFLVDHQNLHHHHQQQHQQPGLSMLIQGLLEPPPEAKEAAQQSVFDPRAMSYQIGGSNTSNYHGSSCQQQQQIASAGHLQFANNTAYWNPSAGAAGEARTGFYPTAMPVQFGSAQSYDQKPSCSSLTLLKSNSDSAQKRSGGGGSGSRGGEPALKKSRVETPSPLPTFKVRKEKLGDRITALQQLVSPFGKTDTASVLHEAIEYIKLLHEQVSVLSTPYLKSGHPMQHQQASSDKSKEGEGPRQDLRSRGLCLVPIESTYPVASETMADFWTPTFGGSYR